MLELFSFIPLTIQLNEYLIERAWQEPKFQQQLIEQPRKTLETALNIKIPAGINYQILKDNITDYHLVLPYVPNNSTAEQKQQIYQQTANNYDVSWQTELVRLFEQIENPDIRQALLKNPKAYLSSFLEINLPEQINIYLFEDNIKQRYLVLPYNMVNKNRRSQPELEEYNLAVLAGGMSSVSEMRGDSNVKC